MNAIKDKRGILVDLDGTLICGGRLISGASAFIEAVRDRCIIVSNDAEHLPADIARKLSELGVDLPAEQIVLAGTLALERLASTRPGARVLVRASPKLRNHAQKLGLELGETDVEAVFLGRDRDFDYAALAVVANAVRCGAHLVVANPDLTHPALDGGVVPETGALLAAVLACTGNVRYEVVGKPEVHLLKTALELMGLRPQEAVMIGDNPATDGLGAHRLGIPFVQVGPTRPLTLDLLRSTKSAIAETV